MTIGDRLSVGETLAHQFGFLAHLFNRIEVGLSAARVRFKERSGDRSSFCPGRYGALEAGPILVVSARIRTQCAGHRRTLVRSAAKTRTIVLLLVLTQINAKFFGWDLLN